MNDIFDFGRFGKLLKYECLTYLPRYIKVIPVFASILVFIWLFVSVTFDFEISSRAGFIFYLYLLAIWVSPYFVYGDINNRKKGYIYSMLPVSILEKMLSMTIVSVILVPVISYVILTLIDLLLYGFYCAGIGCFSGFEPFNPAVMDITPFFEEETIDNFLSGRMILAMCVSSVTTSMMFNALFRRFKIVKTLLLNMAVSFICNIVSTILMLLIPLYFPELIEFIYETINGYSDEEFLAIMYEFSFWWYMVVILFTLIVTFFRVKRVNY